MNIKPCTDLHDSQYDVVILVNDSIKNLGAPLAQIESALSSYEKINPKISTTLELLPFPDHPSHRLIFSPTGKLDGDTDDSRNIYDAAYDAAKKSKTMGFRMPLLVLGPLASGPTDACWMQGDFPFLNGILGVLSALYTPIEVAEAFPERNGKFDVLGVFGASEKQCTWAYALEEGRRVTRDIFASDPERMAAPKVVEYIRSEFAKCQDVNIEVDKVDPTEYPLMAMVNRCASGVPRHDGRVVHMVYKGQGSEDTTIFLVGKGITYDTGGADLKVGGHMAGMSKDKGGAAAVAGFFKTLSILKPKGLRVVGSMAIVRNSIGSDCYVADELITSRAGVRLRIGNTDAEGRMVMTDLLCEAKEQALKAVNPFLYTIATLTGHACLSYKTYTAVMDNGPARRHKNSQKLQKAGDCISDMAEISTVRKEDYDFVKGPSEYEDLMQSNNGPSVASPRGHQFPAAFMACASGLDKHGLGCEKEIPYTHMDIAGSSGMFAEVPTASPLAMLANMYILPRL